MALEIPSLADGILAHSWTELILQRAVPLLLTLYLLRAGYYCFFHPLHAIPGPWLARFSKSWINIHYFRGSWLDDVIGLHQKYGPVVRIAPDEVSFVDESALKQLYGHGKPSIKTPWYDAWIVPGLTMSMFPARDPKYHKTVRSRVSAVYSMSSMLSTEPLLQTVLVANWRKLRQLASQGQPINLSTWVGYFTFEVVSALGLGGMQGFLEKGEDIDGIMESLHDGFFLMANMGHMPLQMFWFNNRLSQWLVRNYGGKKLNTMAVFVDWFSRLVEERQRNGLQGTRKDMLQYFIEAKTVDSTPMTKADIVVEGINLLGAGADTTASAINAVLGELLLRPEVLASLREEIDAAYDTLGHAQAGSEITYKETEKLPLLCAIVKETMRLYPSIPYQLPRVVQKEGVQIGPHFIPGGLSAGISAAAMNRSKEIFGPDADDWRPGRWIADREEEVKRIRYMDSNLTHFGMGSRSCIGKHLAMVEVHKYIAQFVRSFDAELVNKEKPWNTRTQWFTFRTDFWVKISERKLANGKV